MIEKKYIALAIVLSLCWIFIFVIGDRIEHAAWKRMDKSCLVPCTTETCKATTNALRGRNYGCEAKLTTGCAYTFWENLHVLLYVGIGYFFPMPICLMITCGFEVYEQVFYGFGSWLDLGWNTMGACMGKTLRHVIEK